MQSFQLLPPSVLGAVAQVLAQQTNLDQNLTADAVKQAFQSSGLFLETSLASGSSPSPGDVPDLKAALIVLRQALSASLESPEGTGVAPATAPQPAAQPELRRRVRSCSDRPKAPSVDPRTRIR